MLQNHSFFSCPLIFFGTHEHSIEEESNDEDWIFTDPWSVDANPKRQIHQSNRIGLCIVWCEPEKMELENESTLT